MFSYNLAQNINRWLWLKNRIPGTCLCNNLSFNTITQNGFLFFWGGVAQLDEPIDANF